MRILFVSRAYPPIVGGIEKQNYEILQSLSKSAEVKSILNKRGKKFLPFFIPYALLKMFLLRKQYDVVLFGDGVLAILAFCSRIFTRKKMICIVHGLDLSFAHVIYRTFWWKLFLKKIDRFIAVGNETIAQGERIGLNPKYFSFIPNGVRVSSVERLYDKPDLEKVLGKQTDGKVILTLGRLVERKGVVWFLKNVMPNIAENITYVIAGRGPEAEHVQQAIHDLGLNKRVVFLGGVSDEQRDILMATADLFIQPNIPVKNDMEGFGLVVLEAGLVGTYVVASQLEGLKDAVTEGENGTLVKPLDANDYTETIQKLLDSEMDLKKKSKQAQLFVQENYCWDKISAQYLNVMEKEMKTQ